MGYKRKARIAFLAGNNGSLAAIAAGLANALGGTRIEARAAAFYPSWPKPAAIEAMRERGIPLTEEPLPLPDTQLFLWADLVITLDAGARASCQALPGHAQKKHYPFDLSATPTIAACRELAGALQARIESIERGMAMMEKAAAENATPSAPAGRETGAISSAA